MKVFLDDTRETPEGYIRANTVHELAKLLMDKDNNITEISLDHDLGEDTLTGYEFMRWLEAMVFNNRISNIPEIKFHTANPVGRKNMELVLASIKKILEKRNVNREA